MCFTLYFHSGIAYDFPDSGGYGGNTTTSEACRKVYRSRELRERLVALCPQVYQIPFRQLLLNDLTILRLTSCNYRVLVEEVGKFSQTYFILSFEFAFPRSAVQETATALCPGHRLVGSVS